MSICIAADTVAAELGASYRDERNRIWTVKAFMVVSARGPWYEDADPAEATHVHVMTDPQGSGRKASGKFMKRSAFEAAVTGRVSAA